MKIRFVACLLLIASAAWLSGSSPARAATEIWPVTTGHNQPVPFVQVEVKAVGGPLTNNANGYAVKDVFYYTGDSNGIVTMTNLLVGTFTAGATGPYQDLTPVTFNITNFNSTNYVTANPAVPIAGPGAFAGYTQTFSDGRYPSLAGSNITFTMVGGRLKISAIGGTNGGGATNLATTTTNGLMSSNQVQELNSALQPLGDGSQLTGVVATGVTFPFNIADIPIPFNIGLLDFSGFVYGVKATGFIGPASSATNLLGPFAGDVTGTQGATVVAHVATNALPGILPAVANGNGIGLSGVLHPANNLSDVASPSTSAHNLGLGSADSPTFNNVTVSINFTAGGFVISSNSTVSQPLQLYTNAASDNGNGFNMIQMGTAANPAMFKFTLLPNHGGIGDGSAVAMYIRRLVLLSAAFPDPDNNIIVQVGGSGLLGKSAFEFSAHGASSGIPLQYGNVIMQYEGAYWNGATSITTSMDTMLSAIDPNGNGTMSIFQSHSYANANDDPVALGVPVQQQVMSGRGVKNYGAIFVDRTNASPATTNYAIDLGFGSSDVVMSSALNVGLTNLPYLTNTYPGTLNELNPVVRFFPGTAAYPISWTNNGFTWIWPPSGAPTNVPANTILEVSIRLAPFGAGTNCYATTNLLSYTPVVDADAVKFFTAIVNAGASLTTAESNAVNARVMNAKFHGYFTKWVAKYPFVGGTSNSCKFNLASTNFGTITWHSQSATNFQNSAGSFGVYGDGIAFYADTGINLSTAITSPTNMMLAGWLRGPTTPSDSRFMEAGDGSARTGLLKSGGSYLTDGFNALANGTEIFASGGVWNGFFGANLTTSTNQQMYLNGITVGGTTPSSTASILPNATVYIFARNLVGGSPPTDSYSLVNLTFAEISQNMTAQNVLDDIADDAAMNASLGR